MFETSPAFSGFSVDDIDAALDASIESIYRASIT